MNKAPFIVLEGIDGCGKTSAIKAIAKKFPHVHITREPGGTFLAERIREFLLSEKGAILSPEEQMTMFFAARQIHLEVVIDKKRCEGIPVITDRFDGSTFAFQKCVELIDGEFAINTQLFNEFNKLREHVVAGHEPSLYIYMKVDPSEGMRRRAFARDKVMNHFDLASIQEQERRDASYERFFWSVSSSGTHVATVNANRPQHEVLQEVLSLVEKELS